MKEKKVYLYDPDLAYLAHLTAKLGQYFSSNYSFIQVKKQAEILNLDYYQVDCLILNEEILRRIFEQKLPPCLIVSISKVRINQAYPVYYRFDSIKALVKILRHDFSFKARLKSNQQMYLVNFFDKSQQNSWLKAFLKTQLEQQKEVHLLPLMPLYMIEQIKESKSGPRITELLMHLEAGFDQEDLNYGHYIHLSQSGLWLPRFDLRSDDIISLQTDSLRQLLLCLKDFLSKRKNSLALIPCASLTWSKVKRLVGLCSHFVAERPIARNHASQIKRRELSLFLASLDPAISYLEVQDV